MNRKAHIHTYGCQMNEHDSSRMAEVLIREGFIMTDEPEEAVLIILNTCSVRANPENKVYSHLGRLRPLKRRNPSLIIGVGGCVAQQAGEAIMRREKIVDMVFGPDHFFRLPEMLEAVAKGERVLMTDAAPPPPDRVGNFVPEEWVEAGHVEGCTAHVAIMKGCDNFCSFCIVPYTRGREVSREPGNIMREVRDLVGRDAREIWLLGQNVNSYKADGWGFLELLDAVSQVEGLARVRFTSPHPKDWDDALSDLMAARSTICKHLHLPFQAGSNRILDLMRRKHTIETYLDKVRYLRQANPGVSISTDLIVGFPSETEEDFGQTLRVVNEVRFSQLFAFKYSTRPGTMAAKMEDDVSPGEKARRLDLILKAQDRITEEQMARAVGTEEEVLIDAAHPRLRGNMNGRTDGYRPVTVRSSRLEVGDLVPVRITGWRNHWLEGELLPSPARA